jgi:hypothetical protein
MNKRMALSIAAGATFLLLAAGIAAGGFFSQGGDSGPTAALASTAGPLAGGDVPAQAGTVQDQTRNRPARYDDDDDEREHRDSKSGRGERPERRESSERRERDR